MLSFFMVSMFSFLKAWMLSFLSVGDVIILHGVNVIIFKGLDVIIFPCTGWVLSFMLSYNVIILCYHFPPFFFFLNTWHYQNMLFCNGVALKCYTTLCNIFKQNSSRPYKKPQAVPWMLKGNKSLHFKNLVYSMLRDRQS